MTSKPDAITIFTHQCIYKIDIMQITSKSNCIVFVCLFGLRLYVPVNTFSNMSGRFPGLNHYKAIQRKCLAQGHNTTPLVRFKPMTLRSRVLYSTNLANGAPLFVLKHRCTVDLRIVFSYARKSVRSDIRRYWICSRTET